ncbi:MAG: hypothetical protein ONB44_06690 [candidate division KSB1 bacterium]|nr:hypothetical protein [candidate division KSB1 bacterium]MDZ7301811.1 hypothetical protein [candidate division KSB1 bacterium]MDZ7314163.1 hypothetical protein [candidate division KSB1 bacterium]
MKNHVKILGGLYLVFGILGLIVAIVFLNALTGQVAFPRRLLIFSTSGFGAVLAFFFAIVSVPAIIGGTALLLRQPWARILVLILGFVNIFNIPLGTILGIYTIWVLTREQATQELKGDKTVEPRVFPPYH